jgi:hypothetical protein
MHSEMVAQGQTVTGAGYNLRRTLDYSTANWLPENESRSTGLESMISRTGRIWWLLPQIETPIGRGFSADRLLWRRPALELTIIRIELRPATIGLYFWPQPGVGCLAKGRQNAT